MTPSSHDLLNLRCDPSDIRLNLWQNAHGVEGFHIFSQTLFNKKVVLVINEFRGPPQTSMAVENASVDLIKEIQCMR
jgi:hypothetical protein